MNRSVYFNYFSEKISSLATLIEIKGKINILDTHIHAEIFYRDFFNLLFNWTLEKTEKANEPGIDLIDENNKIVVSISSTATKEKIQNSLVKINIKYSGYAFKFISISKDASNLRSKEYSIPQNSSFSPAEDIYDVPKILNIIFELDIDRQRELYEFLKKELENETDSEKLKPIDRLKNYLRDSNNWKYVPEESQNSVFHYERFPEFTIVKDDDFFEQYKEPWVSIFPDKHAGSRLKYLAKHGNTILDRIHLISCDLSRFVTAEPQEWSKTSPQMYHYSYYFIKDSIDYLAAQMVTTKQPNNCREHSIYKEFQIFNSKEEAHQLIDADFESGMRQYIYYSFDMGTRQYLRLERGVSSPVSNLLCKTEL